MTFFNILLTAVNASFTLYLSRKQVDLPVVMKCVERYQKIMGEINMHNKGEPQWENAVRQYLILCDEEGFYLRHRYISETVMYEWLEAMIYYLPHLKDGRNVNKSSYCLEVLENNLLEDHPRLKESLTVTREYDLFDPSERRKLVKSVRRKLKRTRGY